MYYAMKVLYYVCFEVTYCFNIVTPAVVAAIVSM